MLDGCGTGELTSECGNYTFFNGCYKLFLFDTSLLGEHLDRVKYVISGFFLLNLLCHFYIDLLKLLSKFYMSDGFGNLLIAESQLFVVCGPDRNGLIVT